MSPTVNDTRGQTAEPHLHTGRKDGLQHFTDLNVTEPRAPRSTHAVLDDGQYAKQYDFVAGRVAGFEFAVRDGGTDRRKGNVDR
jgi:hypothetical protein